MKRIKKIVISILMFFTTLNNKVFGIEDIMQIQPAYGVINPEPQKTLMQLLGEKILEIIYIPIILIIGVIAGIIYIYKNRKSKKMSVKIIKAIFIGIPIGITISIPIATFIFKLLIQII